MLGWLRKLFSSSTQEVGSKERFVGFVKVIEAPSLEAKEPDEQSSTSGIPEVSVIVGRGDQVLIGLSAEIAKSSLRESLEIAENSDIVDTKVSRLEVARAKLNELKLMAIDLPEVLDDVNVVATEEKINSITRMFVEKMYYAKAGYFSREYSPSYLPIKFQAFGLKVNGWRAVAKIELGTPLRILNFHWAPWVSDESNQEPPSIDGISWIAEYSHDILAEAEIDKIIDSDIGPIQQDGGMYLEFLKAVQKIAERVDPIQQRISDLEKEIEKPEWSYFHDIWSADDVISTYFSEFIDTIPKLSLDIKISLISMGMKTPSSLMNASDKDLLAIHGIGPAKLKIIRQACDQAEDVNSEWVDCVNR